MPYGLGGAGNLLLQQARLMSDIYNVTIVIPMDKNGNFNTEYARRCDQYQMPYTTLRYDTAFSFSFIDFISAMESVEGIEKFAKENNITFFHSVQLNIAVEYVSRKLKIPHLMNIYQLAEEEFITCPGDIYPQYHLCDSLLYANRWHQQLGIESRCVRPVALFEKIQKKSTYIKEKIKILMLGDVCARKNQLEAIKAIRNCIQLYDIELHIAGTIDKNYGDECKRYVENHNLDHFIFFHGFISDICPLLEENDCLLCTSIDESFPSAIVEALTYDLTIISTPVAGVPEIFIDKKNSFISKDFTYQSITKSVLECLSYYKYGYIKEIHMNSENTWKENFHRNIVRNKIDDYYHDILGGKQNFYLNSFYSVGQMIWSIKSILNNIDDMGERWIHSRYLHYLAIKKVINTKGIYIWGAGKRGKLTYEILKAFGYTDQIVAFVDQFKKGIYCSIPINKIEDIQVDKNKIYCISFAIGNDNAIQYLEKKGLELNRQIWNMP